MTTTAKTGIRCPHCRRKLAERLLGEMWVRCPRCESNLHFNFDKGKVINLN